MPEFITPTGHGHTWQSLPDDFTRGYIEAAFFTECHADNPELEAATFSDIEQGSLETIIADCRRFQDENSAVLASAYAIAGYNETKAGSDFWFTRNGHGTGFWDRYLGQFGDLLTAAANAYGEIYVYRDGYDDDTTIYFVKC